MERERERERERELVGFSAIEYLLFCGCHASSRCIVRCSDVVFCVCFVCVFDVVFFNLTHPYNLLYSFVFDVLHTFRYTVTKIVSRYRFVIF